ncbi:cohesin domain-containing protein [Paenibacillus sp. LHD-117]|uniref:cohesin domain-containing protein n=1 Tax=Paenibacillus sp. LHD-117 TaxID=3071412 RepID=UPI0027E1E53E|nr:cohesin domain-containing protein [Paenibacillus sp. LHD-117]MDQ6423500.1 cohesin domain-containing protein [Paenibacillus sp. LHD-117]
MIGKPKKVYRKAIALVLAFMMLVGANGSDWTSGAQKANAASGSNDPLIEANEVSSSETPASPNVGTLKNYIVNSGFESDSNLTRDVTKHVGHWVLWLSNVAANVGRNNTRAAVITQNGSSLEQDIVDLKPNTEYVIQAWAKSTNPSAQFFIGVKNFGGGQSTVHVDSTEYKQYQLTFRTGSSNTSARVFFWKDTGSGTGYVDDYEVWQKSSINSVSIQNDGRLEISFKSIPQSVQAGDFESSYTSSMQPDQSMPVALSNFQFDAATGKVTYRFEPLPTFPVSQQITHKVKYKPDGSEMQVTYELPANGEPIVEPVIEAMTAENGRIELVLQNTPNPPILLSDIEVTSMINDDDSVPLPIESYQYLDIEKKIVLTFAAISRGVNPKNVQITVNIKDEAAEGSFIVDALGEGNTYYVDNVDGDDLHDGLSKETAWKSLDKVNATTFSGGDKLLFKAGGEWTGQLWPKGSGVEGKPIIIDKYGDGPKPRFMPGPDVTTPYMTWVNTTRRNVKVNNGLLLSNQSYWEINSLELFDPSYSSVDPYKTDVYRRGVYIHGEDVGELKHIYLNDLHIHGYRGPYYNEGKVSGGIIVHIFTNPDDVSKRKKTWIDDLKITNNKIEQVGRSGINFHTPWTTRKAEDGKWANFSYVGAGEWTPFTNVYIGHNIFKEIDGDGTIIDNTEGTVFEHNLVYKALNNSGYAAGVFSWNSNDTVIQFNELSHTGRGNDAQGVEIDALNDNTIVQYNYSHDNFGGFFEWCTIPGYPSYNGTLRYNISQNDGTGYGVITLFTNNFGSKAYNNTIYLGPGLDRTVFSRKSGSYNNRIQFFNNIVYNDGGLTNLNFHTDVVEYSNNLFYGFPNAPAGSITADPKLEAIGTGGNYHADGPDVFSTLTGYRPLPDSPAIDAGRAEENNGGRDFFGTSLTNGLPDIGAVEYVEEEEQEPVSLELAGPASVKSGDSFVVNVGLSHVETPVLAQDITFQYDSGKFEFVEALSVADGVNILETVHESGQIRMLLFSEGPERAISGDREVIKLTFNAKPSIGVASGEISATRVVLADKDGVETEAALSSLRVEIGVAGVPGDFNGDERISIGDLAMLAVHFGKNSHSPDWEQVKKLDLNGDGFIDIIDLAELAQQIVLS